MQSRSLLGGFNEDLLAVSSALRADFRVSDLIGDIAAMQAAADLPDIFAGLARAVVHALKADACVVSQVHPDKGILRDVAAHALPPATMNLIAEEYLIDEYPATKTVLQTGEPIEVSVNDPTADAAERRFVADQGFQRSLMLRLAFDEDVVGTVEAFRLGDRSFRHDDPAQVQALVGLAANTYSRIQLASRLDVHYTKTIEALVAALEVRDPYTQAHAGRIVDQAMALSIALKVPVEERRGVKLGAILHDVGKIGISDSILQKPGPLNDEEWAIMRTHPEIGERMLRNIDFLSPALPVIRHHHERWDGRGYPDGLAGNDIPIGARIVAVCDAFDAMTTDRPYRAAMTTTEACAELTKGAGSQFDPDCATFFVDMVWNVGDEQLQDRFVRYAG